MKEYFNNLNTITDNKNKSISLMRLYYTNNSLIGILI